MKNQIQALKREKNAVILAHYYTRPEVQDIADFVGDSLALSIEAARTEASVILFAGVYFMAETAKILSPDKTVLIPDPEAGCSLAESCPATEFLAFKTQHPDAIVVSYVNTTAEIKALTDICCTSSNALQVINSIPKNQPIIFAPDKNLGSWLQKQTGRTNIILWDGACHVHEAFSPAGIRDLKTKHPTALVLAHPECPADILTLADFVGSTSAILDFATSESQYKQKSAAAASQGVAQILTQPNIFIIATEPGIIHELRRLAPHKTFIPAPGLPKTTTPSSTLAAPLGMPFSTTNAVASLPSPLSASLRGRPNVSNRMPGGACHSERAGGDEESTCNECSYMKLATLPKILAALTTLTPEVTVPETTRAAAEKSIRNMLAL